MVPGRKTSALAPSILLTLLGCGPSAPGPAAPAASASAPPGASAPPAPVVVPAGGRVNNADQVLAAARTDTRRCFMQSLTVDDRQEGKLTFELVVDERGAVARVDLTPSGTLIRPMVSCASDVLKKLVFEPPEGGAASVKGSFTLKKQQ